MKRLVFFNLFLLLPFTFVFSANSGDDRAAITKTISNFSKYGDQQNEKDMKTILHDQFRAIINRQFGSSDVTLMDKTAYLGALSAKKIGGDQREVNISDIEIIGNSATATVQLNGSKLNFSTFMTLVKTEKGIWELISDVPHIIAK